MRKTLLDILTRDNWPEPESIMPGVVRQGSYNYAVDPKEAYAVLTFSDGGAAEQKPDRLTVEVTHLSDEVLIKNIAGLIGFLTKDLEPTNVMSDRLERYLKDNELAHVLCHSSVELPVPGVRHEDLPVVVDRNTYTVIACTEHAGVIAQTSRGLRGAFLRPRSFCKLRLEFPAPTALERVLGEDPFGEIDEE